MSKIFNATLAGILLLSANVNAEQNNYTSWAKAILPLAGAGFGYGAYYVRCNALNKIKSNQELMDIDQNVQTLESDYSKIGTQHHNTVYNRLKAIRNKNGIKSLYEISQETAGAAHPTSDYMKDYGVHLLSSPEFQALGYSDQQAKLMPISTRDNQAENIHVRAELNKKLPQYKPTMWGLGALSLACFGAFGWLTWNK